MEQLFLQMLQEDVALFPLEKQSELQKAWEQELDRARVKVDRLWDERGYDRVTRAELEEYQNLLRGFQRTRGTIHGTCTG